MIPTQWGVPLHDDQLFFLIVAVVIALFCCGMVFHYLKRARLIEDTPTSKIRSAAQGYVEIVGTVSPLKNRELVAPLSGRACVWYSYKIQRQQRSGRNNNWSTVEEGVSDQRFVIRDDTGVCVIQPKGAEVTTAHSRTWYGKTPRPDQVDTRNFLLKALDGRRYRYIEKFIFTHDIIYALGTFGSDGGGRNIPTVHQMTGQVIREWRQNFSAILHRFDRDNNGELDLQEWDAVREAAGREAEKRRKQLTQVPTMHLLSKTIDKRQPFILSTFSQKILAKRFRRYAFFNLAGVMLSISVGVAYLHDWQSFLATALLQ